MIIRPSSLAALTNRNRLGFGFLGITPLRCQAESRKPKRFFAFRTVYPSTSGRVLTKLMGLHGPHPRNTGTSSPDGSPSGLFVRDRATLASNGGIVAFGLNDNLKGLWVSVSMQYAGRGQES